METIQVQTIQSHEKILQNHYAIGNSGITYENEETVEQKSLTEFNLLKLIVQREEYLKRLTIIANKTDGKIDMIEIANQFDLIRMLTVEVIEGIQQWQKEQRKPSHFLWNGIDYILKIPSDLDCFEKNTQIITWLGFSMEKNPFILPSELLTTDVKNGDGLEEESIYIGGYVRKVPKPLKEKKKPLHASTVLGYATRIINNNELLPPKLLKKQTKKESKEEERIERSGNFSMVKKSDIGRIQAADKYMNQETNLMGKYQRDTLGNIVPETQALQDISNKTVIAEIRDEFMEEKKEMSLPAPIDTVSGKSKGRKYFGTLSPLTLRGSHGELVVPSKRYQPYNLEDSLMKSTSERDSTEKEMITLQKEIDTKQQVLDHLRGALEGAQPSLLDTTYKLATDASAQAKEDLLKKEEEALRAELKEVQCRLERLKKYYELKCHEVTRKEESIFAFKCDQKQKLDEVRQTRIQSVHEKRHSILKPFNEDMLMVRNVAATQIQKHMRGVVTRKCVREIRATYEKASTRIQAISRGFLGRKHCKTTKYRHKAATRIQKHIRGMLARAIAKQRKLCRDRLNASIAIQKIVRGFMGRNYMKDYRTLLSAASQMQEIIKEVEVFSFESLACLCNEMTQYDELPLMEELLPASVLLVIKLFHGFLTFPYELNDSKFQNYTWRQAYIFLYCDKQLRRRLRCISYYAGKKRLPYSKTLLAEYIVLCSEEEFTVAYFKQQQSSRIPLLFYQWLETMDIILRYQETYLTGSGEFNETADDHAEDRLQYDACTQLDHRLNAGFLRELLYQTRPSNSRLLIIFATDIPFYHKNILIKLLGCYFGGQFYHTKLTKEMTLSHMIEAFQVNYNIVLEADIGLTITTRNIFLSSMRSIVYALGAVHDKFQCIVCYGAFSNRLGNPLETTNWMDPIDAEPEDLEPKETMYGVAKHDMENSTDREIKQYLQLAYENLYHLHQSKCHTEMIQYSKQKTPTEGFAFVMEALLILMSPKQRFCQPGTIALSVSWQMASRLLQYPIILLKQIDEIDIQQIPLENSRILLSYLTHPNWPSSKFSQAVGGLYYYLTKWIESVLLAYDLAIQKIGYAKPIVADTVMFSRVIEIRDQAFALPLKTSSELLIAKLTAKHYMQELLFAMASCSKVYYQIYKLLTERWRITLYRYDQYFLVVAYNPSQSLRFVQTLTEDAVENLLLRNSTMSLAALKLKLKTIQNVYQQLVEFCQLSQHKRTGEYLFAVYPPRIRIYREIRKLYNRLVIFTVYKTNQRDYSIAIYDPKREETITIPVESTGTLPEKAQAKQFLNQVIGYKQVDWKSRHISQCYRIPQQVHHDRLRYQCITPKSYSPIQWRLCVYENEKEFRITLYNPLTSYQCLLAIAKPTYMLLFGTLHFLPKVFYKKTRVQFQNEEYRILCNTRLYRQYITLAPFENMKQRYHYLLQFSLRLQSDDKPNRFTFYQPLSSSSSFIDLSYEEMNALLVSTTYQWPTVAKYIPNIIKHMIHQLNTSFDGKIIQFQSLPRSSQLS